MEALSTQYRDTVRSGPAVPLTVYENPAAYPFQNPEPESLATPPRPSVAESALAQPQTALGRTFDVMVALVAALVFLPFLILTAIAIKISTPGPALFVQRRVGRDGKLFPCLKFRTMVVNSQEVLAELLASSPEARAEWDRDQKLRRDPRITPLGHILRKSSLDELPQLFNILAGHMSIVGPRPIVEAEIPRYGDRFAFYCSVRPGLTGLWQVSGRNDVSYETRVRLDAFYAMRKSTVYDFAICLRTVPAVLSSRGVF